MNKENIAIKKILKGANKGLAAISPEYQFIDYNTIKITVKTFKGLSTTFYITRYDLKDIEKLTKVIVDRYKRILKIKNDVSEKAAYTIKILKDCFEIFDFLLEHDKDKTITEIKNDFIFKMGNKVYEYLQEI
ncbi:MAG: hypothetical protein QXL51_07290 [Candidatus Aenigmatarchaeota archaeon]